MKLKLGLVLGSLVAIGFSPASRADFPVSSQFMGSEYTDCQLNTYPNKYIGILCPLRDYPVKAIAGSHQVLPNEWSGFIVASGGGMVDIVLPSSPPRGPHVYVSFSTDGTTGFRLHSPGAEMQGTAPVVGGVITAGPGATGSAVWNGTLYNVAIYQGPPISKMH